MALCVVAVSVAMFMAMPMLLFGMTMFHRLVQRGPDKIGTRAAGNKEGRAANKKAELRAVAKIHACAIHRERAHGRQCRIHGPNAGAMPLVNQLLLLIQDAQLESIQARPAQAHRGLKEQQRRGHAQRRAAVAWSRAAGGFVREQRHSHPRRKPAHAEGVCGAAADLPAHSRPHHGAQDAEQGPRAAHDAELPRGLLPQLEEGGEQRAVR
mmetsp:Transcript_79367/g.233179  ORF Transcript_79367/g.233179 Transcript_79367/m.233179 type:complete len:210 (-) Transcript_79367:910-1539(-)